MGIKIIAESHVHESCKGDVLVYALEQLKERTGFFIQQITIPSMIGTVDCDLYGPLAGDSVVLDKDCWLGARGTRTNLSRLVKRPSKKTNVVTVIAGPEGNDPCVLYTIFGGPLSPKEPTDPTLKGEEQIAESKAFWSVHALACPDGKSPAEVQAQAEKIFGVTDGMGECRNPMVWSCEDIEGNAAELEYHHHLDQFRMVTHSNVVAFSWDGHIIIK